MNFTARCPEGQGPLARVLVDLKSRTHGEGHSADWVHGYWRAIDDVAAEHGISIEPPTRKEPA